MNERSYSPMDSVLDLLDPLEQPIVARMQVGIDRRTAPASIYGRRAPDEIGTDGDSGRRRIGQRTHQRV